MMHDTYLEAKILTAPRHRLQLMLIEAALRHGRKAEEALRAGDAASASAPLARTIDILGELLAAARQNKSELNVKIADFYQFLFRRVCEAKINDDAEKLAEALSLLEYERETWQLVCDRLGSAAPEAPLPVEMPATGGTSSLSLEA